MRSYMCLSMSHPSRPPHRYRETDNDRLMSEFPRQPWITNVFFRHKDDCLPTTPEALPHWWRRATAPWDRAFRAMFEGVARWDCLPCMYYNTYLQRGRTGCLAGPACPVGCTTVESCPFHHDISWRVEALAIRRAGYGLCDASCQTTSEGCRWCRLPDVEPPPLWGHTRGAILWARMLPTKRVGRMIAEFLTASDLAIMETTCRWPSEGPDSRRFRFSEQRHHQAHGQSVVAIAGRRCGQTGTLSRAPAG